MELLEWFQSRLTTNTRSAKIKENMPNDAYKKFKALITKFWCLKMVLSLKQHLKQLQNIAFTLNSTSKHLKQVKYEWNLEKCAANELKLNLFLKLSFDFSMLSFCSFSSPLFLFLLAFFYDHFCFVFLLISIGFFLCSQHAQTGI